MKAIKLVRQKNIWTLLCPKQKVKLISLIIILMASVWGWTIFYFLFPPMYQESQKVWQEHLQRQLNNGIGDSVKEVIPPKTESFVPAESVESQYVDSREEVAQTTPPNTSVEELIEKTWNNEDAKIAIATAKSESHLDCKAIGDGHLAFYREGIEYGKSYGIFQIRYLPGRPSPEKLLDPDFNVRYAKQLFDKSGWKPWSGYTSGRYLAFMD